MISGDEVVEQLQPVQRRHHPRRRIEAAVAVCGVASSYARTWRGHTLNLSEGGAGVIVAGPWIPGQVVRMEIAFYSGQTTTLFARIAHRNRLYCGLEFLGNGEESRSELRQYLAS